MKGGGADGHYTHLVASPGRAHRVRKVRLAQARRWVAKSGPVTVRKATPDELRAAQRRREGGEAAE